MIEKEDRLAAHQTGHNSGVIHSGLYYKPGSLKARNCTAGREALYRFCAEHGIPRERCGKVVVATRRGAASGARGAAAPRARPTALTGLRRLRPEEIREIEPHAAGIAGLFVPQTGIVDYARVTEAYAEEVRAERRRDPARRVACGASPATAAAWCSRPARARCAAGISSTAPGSRPTAWRAWPGWSPACGSCRSAASTTSWCPSAATWSGT